MKRLLMSLACVLWAACGGSDSDGSDGGSSGNGSEAGTDASTGDGTGDAGGGGLYEDCVVGACEDGMLCVPYSVAAVGYRWCAPTCDEAQNGTDCPPAPEGASAGRVCIDYDGTPVCALGCNQDPKACPDGMACPSSFCAWP